MALSRIGTSTPSVAVTFTKQDKNFSTAKATPSKQPWCWEVPEIGIHLEPGTYAIQMLDFRGQLLKYRMPKFVNEGFFTPSTKVVTLETAYRYYSYDEGSILITRL